MKRLLTFACAFCLASATLNAQTTSTEVLFETTKGNIRIALYDETPQHRDNFLKLTKMGSYDSLLFHRVIKDFMIQTGDIFSKKAKPGQLLGSGDYDYTTEAEFRLPKIFHRRGVVAAAREGDEKNPERRSGASQFYMVWGKVYDDRRLDYTQQKILEVHLMNNVIYDLIEDLHLKLLNVVFECQLFHLKLHFPFF